MKWSALPRVWRIDVTLPPGSQTPGWQPPDWDPAQHGPFVWPRRRLCLSRSTAKRWKRQLEAWGAYVTVHASYPIRWPDSPGELNDTRSVHMENHRLRERIAALEEERRALLVAMADRGVPLPERLPPVTDSPRTPKTPLE